MNTSQSLSNFLSIFHIKEYKTKQQNVKKLRDLCSSVIIILGNDNNNNNNRHYNYNK